MAEVYKRPGRKPYYFSYYDHKGIRRWRSTGTTDKGAASIIAAKMLTDAALVRHNVIEARTVDYHEHAQCKMVKHLTDFEASLQQKNNSEKHIAGTRGILDRYIEQQNIETTKDLTGESVSKFLESLKSLGRSARTLESNYQAINAFLKFMVKRGRIPSNPLESIDKPQKKGERAYTRRALLPEEWQVLRDYTRSSGVSYKMTGVERALLYETAIETGLRSSELRSVTRRKLRLGENPHILVGSESTKNKKLAKQDIPETLAAELEKLVEGKGAGDPVFNMPSKFDVADMLRLDIANARATWLASIKNEQKRIEADDSDFLKTQNCESEVLDFHSLRHTTATWKIAQGYDIMEVKNIMRHSTIALTGDIYGHLIPKKRPQKTVEMVSDAKTLDTPWTQKGRVLVPNGATSCRLDTASVSKSDSDLTKENIGSTNENTGEILNRARRIRTFDLRIRNRVVFSKNLAFSNVGHTTDTLLSDPETYQNLPVDEDLHYICANWESLTEETRGILRSIAQSSLERIKRKPR